MESYATNAAKQADATNKRWPPRRVEQAHRIASYVGLMSNVLKLDGRTLRFLRRQGVADPLAASDDAHLLGLAEQRLRGDGTVTLQARGEDD